MHEAFCRWTRMRSAPRASNKGKPGQRREGSRVKSAPKASHLYAVQRVLQQGNPKGKLTCVE